MEYPILYPILGSILFFLYIWGLKPMKKIGSKTDLPMSPLVKSLKSWGLFPWPKTGSPFSRPSEGRRHGEGEEMEISPGEIGCNGF